jgi:hypothetical protein
VQSLGNFPASYGTQGSSPHSQELSTCTYPEPDQSSPQHSILSLKGQSEFHSILAVTTASELPRLCSANAEQLNSSTLVHALPESQLNYVFCVSFPYPSQEYESMNYRILTRPWSSPLYRRLVCNGGICFDDAPRPAAPPPAAPNGQFSCSPPSRSVTHRQ